MLVRLDTSMVATATVHGLYGGHDPEDYRHYVHDPETDLSLHPNSPGYRLILNNILFPAAEKRKKKNLIILSSLVPQSTFSSSAPVVGLLFDTLMNSSTRISVICFDCHWLHSCGIEWNRGWLLCCLLPIVTPCFQLVFAPCNQVVPLGVFDQFPFWFL